MISQYIGLCFTAGRGLDIKPYSKGIDTGCVVSVIIMESLHIDC